jgi:hypothetical protein
VSKQNLGCVSAAAAEAQAKEDRRDLCEQALAGVPDPVALVAAVRECVAVTKPLVDMHAAIDPVLLTEGERARLAALRRLGEVCNGK